MTYFMSVIRFWVGLGFVQCFTGLPVSNTQCLKTTKKSHFNSQFRCARYLKIDSRHFLSELTSEVNVARFARHVVKCDFFQ